jgi:hypothetical protein
MDPFSTDTTERHAPMNAAPKPVFAKYDRASHQEFGDGVFISTHGTHKLSIDFDNFGIKRVSPETLTAATPLPPAALAKLYRERDARRAKAQAITDRYWADQRALNDRYHAALRSLSEEENAAPRTARIIVFPLDRVVRRIEHGSGVVVQGDAVRAPQSAA